MSPESLQNCEQFLPATQAELSRFVAENAGGKKSALYPVGGRTALQLAVPAAASSIIVSSAKLDKVVDYPARDMTITVEAGIRIDTLAAALKAENQQLPIDVPQSNRATLGGIVATNTSGPRRFGYGTLRDYVIGISAVDARGTLFRAGGRVVKNVAGYDLCKMLVGSMGTLAVITQLTLKLKPMPQATSLLWTSWESFSQIDTVLESLVSSSSRPVALEVLNVPAARQIAVESRQTLSTDHPVLGVVVEGTEKDVRWQIDTLKQELSPHGPKQIEELATTGTQRLLATLTDYQTFSDDPLTFQANLLPSKTIEFVNRATQMGIAVQARAGNGIVIGHLPDSTASAEKASEMVATLRSFARERRGNLVIFNCDNGWKDRLPMFGEPEPSFELMQQLKTALDPDDLLNPGRFPAAQ